MNNNKTNIVIVSILFFILSIILYGKSGNIMVDFSRESYIPYQILSGGKLNKDIFLIYGAFGYLFNALLYKIYPNINILLIEGLLISYSITILLYGILKKFKKSIIALVFTIFFVIVSVFSNSNFSFAIPYSYSTIWGVFGIYLLLFSLLYKHKKICYVVLGFILINKIEFFIPAFLVILFLDIYKKCFKFKNYILTLIFPAFNLFFINRGIIKNFKYLSYMLKTNSLKSLYESMGSLFMGEYFIFNLKYLVLYLLISVISYLVFKKNKLISLAILSLLFYLVYPNILFHLGFFIAIILSLINRKKINQNDIFLLTFATILCSKSIFAINSLLYSNFGYVLMIYYIFRQLLKILNKKWVISHFIILILFLSIGQFFDYKNYPKYSLKTNIGTLKLAKNDYELTKKIINFFNDNLKENETLVTIPEGQIFNLIFSKKWDFYNSTFTPMDFETFGEQNLLNKLKENKTDYILFFPRNTREYGAQTICYDYAVDFCAYIMDNYKRVALFENVQKALIFKINEK